MMSAYTQKSDHVRPDDSLTIKPEIVRGNDFHKKFICPENPCDIQGL